MRSWKQLGFGPRKERATLQEECAELSARWDDLVKETKLALIETRCFILGHKWRCLGRYQNPPVPEPGVYASSLMSVWDCERPGCKATDEQQWDL